MKPYDTSPELQAALKDCAAKVDASSTPIFRVLPSAKHAMHKGRRESDPAFRCECGAGFATRAEAVTHMQEAVER